MPAKPGLPPNPAGGLVEEPYGTRRTIINLRVAGLKEILAALRSRSAIVTDVRDSEYGAFAWAQDPDGNIVELWEPAPPS